MEMVCTGEREGIPGSAARPGDAGAASSHCQYVPGTAPTTPPADEGEPADDSSGGEGEPPSTETIVRTALSRVAVSGAGLSWQPRKKSYTNVGVPTSMAPPGEHTTQCPRTGNGHTARTPAAAAPATGAIRAEARAARNHPVPTARDAARADWKARWKAPEPTASGKITGRSRD